MMSTTPASVMDMPTMAEHAGEATQLLKALANQHRLMIMCVLIEGSHSVSELNERVPLSQSALSQHLARLRSEGLVNTRREGLTIYYSLTDSNARQIIHTLHELYC